MLKTFLIYRLHPLHEVFVSGTYILFLYLQFIVFLLWIQFLYFSYSMSLSGGDYRISSMFCLRDTLEHYIKWNASDKVLGIWS